jgi:hypothetical protein
MPCCGSGRRERGPDDPITIGARNGADPVRARVNVTSHGVRIYDVAWFTGDGVDAAVDGDVITPI